MFALHLWRRALKPILVVLGKVSTTVKLGTRIDKSQTMEDKLDSVIQRNGTL